LATTNSIKALIQADAKYNVSFGFFKSIPIIFLNFFTLKRRAKVVFLFLAN
jgi:hypothetical protein